MVKELRSMSHPDFMNLIRAMYGSLMNCIEGLQRQGDVVIQVLQSIRSVFRLMFISVSIY